MDTREAVFKQIFEANSKKIYHLCYGYTGDDDAANDLLQETFLKVWQNLEKFRNQAQISTWIYRITTTRALDHLRNRKSKKRFGLLQRLFGEGNETLYEVPDFNHPGVTLDRKENAALLFKAIKQLPENQKIAFTLHKLEDLSYQEISEVMKTSVAAVESMMHRAKQNLKKALAESLGKKNKGEK